MLKSRLLELVRIEIKDNPPEGYTPRYSDEYLSNKIAEALFYIIPQLPAREVIYSTTLYEGQYRIPLPSFLLKWDLSTLHKKNPSTGSITTRHNIYAIRLVDENNRETYLSIDHNLTSHVVEPTLTSRPSFFRVVNGYIYLNAKADKNYTLIIKGVGVIYPYNAEDYDIPDMYIPLILRYVRYAISLEEYPELAKLHFQAFQMLLDRFLGREP